MPLTPKQAFLDSFRPCAESQYLAEVTQILPGERVLDLGCGTGFLMYALRLREPGISFLCGVEYCEEKVRQADHRSHEADRLAPSDCVMSFVCADARHDSFQASCMDRIICNPPFFTGGHGRPSADCSRHQARTDDTLSLGDVLQRSQSILRHGGSLSLVLPVNALPRLEAACEAQHAAILQQQIVPSIRKRDGGVVFITLGFPGQTSSTLLK